MKGFIVHGSTLFYMINRSFGNIYYIVFGLGCIKESLMMLWIAYLSLASQVTHVLNSEVIFSC